MRKKVLKDPFGVTIITEKNGICVELHWAWIREKKRRWFCRYYLIDTRYPLWGQCEASNKFTAYREAKKQCEYKTRRISQPIHKPQPPKP